MAINSIETVHKSVMPDEVLFYLNEYFADKDLNQIKVLDCTLGGGGHSELILNSHKNTVITAIDRDINAIKRAEIKFSKFEGRFNPIHCSFEDLELKLNEYSNQYFDFILADLGLSSDQLDDTKRGFAFRFESDLDMRMDQTQQLTAYEVLNSYDISHLTRVFKIGGVGNFSRELAKRVCSARELKTTNDFKAVCESIKIGGRTLSPVVPFQAVRMEVNNELGQIKSLLAFAKGALRVGGIMVVISFHSTEDKIVTSQFREWSREEILGKNIVVKSAYGKLITKKAVLPSENEVEKNSRSRSARIRVFQRSVD